MHVGPSICTYMLCILLMPAMFAPMHIRRTSAHSLCFMPGLFIQRHDLPSSVPVSVRALCQSGRQSAELLRGPRRCEGLAEHAMASGAAASNKGEAPHDTHWLSLTWKNTSKAA